LLGGREPKYQKLYEDAIEGINKHLLFRPMVKGDWDIIFPAKVGLKSSGEISNVQYEVAHLTCFIGGMYALGGKMFGREKDLAYAKKFTDGCVWAYQSTATGIMAEGAEVLPCPTFEKCSFNETAWWQSLDPLYGSRDGQVREWEDDQVEIQRFYKQEAERQREEMESGKDTTTPGSIDTGDGEASSQKVVGGSAAPSNSAPDESKFLNKRAAISVEPENVALSSDELRSSRHAYGAAKSDKDDDSAQKVKMSDPSGSGSQQTPSTEAKSAKPASQQEYHSRPDPPRIPHNRHPSSRWSTKPLSHEQFVQGKIKDGVPPGYSSVSFPKYILRYVTTALTSLLKIFKPR
jgi:mannosyl-oligosaccharide alpha-1,2-mannosidase